MNTEQEFFEEFNVPKKEIYIGKKKEQLCNHCEDNCFGCDNKEYKYIYPPITPEIVLKLLFILNKRKCGICIQGYETEKELKDYILWSCIRADGIYEEAKAVFK